MCFLKALCASTAGIALSAWEDDLGQTEAIGKSKNLFTARGNQLFIQSEMSMLINNQRV